jgi:hypothetical protein
LCAKKTPTASRTVEGNIETDIGCRRHPYPWEDDASPPTIEALKDSVVDRLAKCETHGRPDTGSVVVIDTNNEASIGKLQFQAKTVVHDTKLIEGRSIDRK